MILAKDLWQTANMDNLLDILSERRVIIADGAMGTMLFQRGLKPGDCPEKVNLEHPKIVEEITRLYIEAGAEIVQTNSFGASPQKLKPYHLADSAEQINTAAVRIARKASQGKAFIAASCGPSGRILKPYGDIEPEEIYAGFERQISALVSAGADMISIETMTDITEAKLAVKAARAVSPSIPISACMTFDSTPKGFFTIRGVTIQQSAEQLAEAGADIIGSNCGNGIDNMIAVAKQLRQFIVLPILIRSNAGIPRIEDGEAVYPETPEFMAARCRELIELDVKIIGGCCGTTPAHITAIKRVVVNYR